MLSNFHPINNFDFETTLLGGQSFAWDMVDDIYTCTNSDNIIQLQIAESGFLWQTYPTLNNFNYLRQYLRLEIDYNKILNHINKDEHINNAISTLPNTRILRQDFDQTVIGYIISANNNIKSIRRSIRIMRDKWGEILSVRDTDYKLFPSTQTISLLSEDELKTTSIGFRAKYVKAAAERLVTEKDTTKKLYDMDIHEVRKYLMSYKGIGPKVADCIMLYALGFDNITAIDVWGKRFATELYGLDPKLNYESMRDWMSDYFDPYAGWAGQFLFEYIRGFKR
jgi:N-glycosylase/DNA lyase